MSQIICYNNCPVCNSPDIKNVLQAKDHTVSGETFLVAECKNCTLRFTQNVPDISTIYPYYKSENYISHSNTSKGLINSLYQSVRKRTLRQKRRLIAKATGLNTGNLLDVGSGTGTFLQEMKMNGWKVTGLEPDADARQVARETSNVELMDIRQFYKLPAGIYDAITLWHVLEHVHDLHPYMQQLKNLLKENGKIFIAVPNYTSEDAQVYQESWAAYDVPRHLYHFSPQSMKVLLENNGLKLESHLPLWYDSFYISMLSSKYKNGKTNFIASFLNGLNSNIKALNDVKRCSSVIYVISK